MENWFDWLRKTSKELARVADDIEAVDKKQTDEIAYLRTRAEAAEAKCERMEGDRASLTDVINTELRGNNGDYAQTTSENCEALKDAVRALVDCTRKATAYQHRNDRTRAEAAEAKCERVREIMDTSCGWKEFQDSIRAALADDGCGR